jgi:arginyl-tRNA synthetase
MLIRDRIADLVKNAVIAAQASGAVPAVDLPRVEVTRPKDLKHGDYASSLALQVARQAKMPPMAIAQAVAGQLATAEMLAGVEVLPPGFINFRLSDRWLTSQVEAIERAQGRYGDLNLGRGQVCQVEFISANPTGPLHMGSARNAVLGDAVANVLGAAGWNVQREYYVNDAGTQMRTFAETLYRRYLQVHGHEAPLEKDHYQGLYMVDLAQEIAAEYGDRFAGITAEEAIDALSVIGLARIMTSIQSTVERLRIRFDHWFSERSLYEPGGIFEQVLDALRARGLTGQRDGAEWLLTSGFGADRDEVLVRSSGQPGYYASDVAYHYEKFVLREFNRVIDVWAVDHQNQARRMPFMMKALGLDPARLDILLYDMVRLYRDGKEVKLSKRSGDIITIDEVVDEVGTDAVRYLLLTRSNQAVIDFDLDLAVQQNLDNPVFYVQYAHARMGSILRTATERGFSPDLWAKGDVSLLTDPAELALLRKMAELSEVIEKAASQLAPHNLAFYAQDLGAVFHTFYENCRVVSSEPADAGLSLARLRLVSATKAVFARVLGLLGVSAPETM